MIASTSGEVGPPSYDDYDILKETFLCVAREPDVITKVRDGGLTLFTKLERLHADLDFLAWPPLTICLSGLLKSYPGGNKFIIRYRELTHNATTENSSLNHDYIFSTIDGQLVEFGQSILACPQLPEPRQQPMTDEMMDQADQGRQLLRQQTGNLLEVTAGDCGVLFDRMIGLLAERCYD